MWEWGLGTGQGLLLIGDVTCNSTRTSTEAIRYVIYLYDIGPLKCVGESSIMPTTKSLRPRQRLPGTSSAAKTRRKPCWQCNNLDPRGHPNSEYEAGLSKEPTASLALVLDSFNLPKTKAPVEGGCRFCGLLVQALDAFFEGWRGSRRRVNLDLKEKGSIKVGVDGERWNDELVEIYA